MSDKIRQAECTTYVNDSGQDCYALVQKHNENGTFNLDVRDPDSGAWQAVQNVPADRLK